MTNNIPLRIAVSGITGRMGKKVIKCVIDSHQKNYKEVVLGAVITRSGSNICGTDIGGFIGINDVGIVIVDSLDLIKDNFDILIDFTHPNISIEYLKFCVDNNKNMVIGTTGFSASHQSLIKDASRRIGIVYSANFSIGAILMSKLLNIITCIMGNIVDINIIDIHHNKKADIPSGTALMMKKVINDTLSSMFMNEKIMFSSFNIPIHSIRAGDCVGEHSVLFTGIGENLKITHTATNRLIFAYGALHSAIWLGYTKKGLFNMYDVLGINKAK